MSYDNPQLRVSKKPLPRNTPTTWEVLEGLNVLRPKDPALRGTLSRNCAECKKPVLIEASAAAIRDSVFECGWCNAPNEWDPDSP